MNKCRTCGKRSEGEYCFLHKKKKFLSLGKYKLKGQTLSIPNGEDVIANRLIFNFFNEIWKERSHFCEITGEKIYGEMLSIYMHHILPKNKYKQAMFDKENIIILSPNIHGNVENDMYKYEEINNRRNYLLKKYNLI